MSYDTVQALLLRPAHPRCVVHVLFRVAPGSGGDARYHLRRLLRQTPPAVGDQWVPAAVHCTVGFTYRGLEALGMPDAYLRLFSRLAPAFREGAPLRASRLGDTGASAPGHWNPGFALDNAHVLVTLHGARAEIDARAAHWAQSFGADSAFTVVECLAGERLAPPAASPPGAPGQDWVHFGFRDGLVEHRIHDVQHLSGAHRMSDAEVVPHAAGEFLLGYANDEGFNPFALPSAPQKVRSFFRGSSFGALRPMEQDVPAFEQAVARWAAQAHAELGKPVGPDWIKAKLCGRWPGGEAVRPGAMSPGINDFLLDFPRDAQGTGCPWSSHVRRMDARGHAGPEQRRRAVLRRGMAYGPPNWAGAPDGVSRGLLGLFFCASLEDQFELLLGQWASGPPPGGPTGDFAGDPLTGRSEHMMSAALVPLPGRAPLRLTGFKPWTRTLGTAYTWHPDSAALQCILRDDYPEEETGGPWF